MIRLFFLASGMFAMGCEDYLFPGLLPGISESLHTSVVAAAQGCAAFGLAYILSVPLCAFLLSKWPVRHVLIIALGVFLAGSLITLLSSSLPIFILGRFIAGLAGGLYLPVAVAAGAQLVNPAFQGRALSLMWGSNSAGAVFGVPMGLWLASRLGWRATVILILALGLFALAGIVFRKQTLRVEAPPPSLAEQFRTLMNPRVLAVIGVTLLTATGCLGLYSYVSQVLAGTANSSDIAFSLWSLGGLIGTMGIGVLLDRYGKPQKLMAVILAVLFVTIASIPLLRSVPQLGLLPFLVWGAMGWASVTPQQYSLFQIEPGREAILVALNSSAVSLGSVLGTALGGLALTAGFSAGHLAYATSGFVLCALACQLLRTRAR